MSLRLYDTAARSIRDFQPLRAGQVSVYLCGVTVQAPPHIGHIRSSISFDILTRWLQHGGNEVTFIRNVTDIDDKIIAKSVEADVPFWQIATSNERTLSWAYDVLGCAFPTAEPRATGHVPEMIELMQRLIDAGHAYAADGDVYFEVRSYPSYGALSGQNIDEMLPAADSASSSKRDVRDFALWKAAKPGEPSWQTPWGPGRPGWHLECSAMARRYLGAEFDIHCGGLDLIFPHHENEIAQSKAVGDGFASYWMHNAWVTTAGEKMSKSLGNSLLVSEVVQRVRPIELRYYLAAPHYRSHIEYSEDALLEAGQGFRRLEHFLDSATQIVGDVPPSFVDPAFARAMDDDIGVPAALGVVHDNVRSGNKALADADHGAVKAKVGSVRCMLHILGLDPYSEPWSSRVTRDDALHHVVDQLVAAQLAQRQQAREQKDFATADRIRDELTAAGIVIDDTPAGPRWSLGKAE